MEVASRQGHTNASYWIKAMEEYHAHEGMDGFPDLVHLFGLTEERVSAAIQGWNKRPMVFDVLAHSTGCKFWVLSYNWF